MNRVHGFSLVESSSRMEGKEPFFSLLGSAVVTACVSSPFWCFSRFMFVNFSQMLYKIEGSFGLPWWLRWLSVCLQCRRPGSNPWSGRFPGEENGNPLQYSCLENPMDRGAWQATVHGVTELDMTERLHFTSLHFPLFKLNNLHRFIHVSRYSFKMFKLLNLPVLHWPLQYQLSAINIYHLPV